MSWDKEVTRRVIVTTKREVYVTCYDDDDPRNAIYEAFEDLGDYDEMDVEVTEDVVTEEDINEAKRNDRYAEWLDA